MMILLLLQVHGKTSDRTNTGLVFHIQSKKEDKSRSQSTQRQHAATSQIAQTSN